MNFDEYRYPVLNLSPTGITQTHPLSVASVNVYEGISLDLFSTSCDNALSRGKSGVTSRAQTVAGGSGQKGRGVIEGMSAIMQQRHQQQMQNAQLDAITGGGRRKRDTVMEALTMAQALTQPQQQAANLGLFANPGDFV